MHLTPAGWRRVRNVDRIFDRFQELVDIARDELTEPEEIDAFEATLQKVIDRVKAILARFQEGQASRSRHS